MKTQYPRASKIIVYTVAGALGVEFVAVPELLDEAPHRRPIQQLPAQSPLDLANSYGHPETPGIPTAPLVMTAIATTTNAARLNSNDLESLITSTMSRAGR